MGKLVLAMKRAFQVKSATVLEMRRHPSSMVSRLVAIDIRKLGENLKTCLLVDARVRGQVELS